VPVYVATVNVKSKTNVIKLVVIHACYIKNVLKTRIAKLGVATQWISNVQIMHAIK